MGNTGSRRKVSRRKKGWAGGLFLVIVVAGLLIFYFGYRKIYKPNVRVETKDGVNYLYIHTGSSYEQVVSSLVQNKYLCDVKSFEWMAVKMNYPDHVKAGKYRITNGMTNRQLLLMLRSGRQQPVKLIFHNIRFKHELVSDVAGTIEADSVQLLQLLNDDAYLSGFGFNSQTIPAMFIPNTYEFFWNTSAKGFLDRMHEEYQKFWNDQRREKCDQIGLNPVEVSTLASIVEEESQKNDEKPVIAGVYMNRLKLGMPLQADPTVRFALGNFAIKRIYEKYLEIDSPYNTYKYKGLPPGPICIPSISSINAVLDYQHHKYLYFCARGDFSGYHDFSKTLREHNRNAIKYQRVLNKAGIRK